mgnify:CR=1 FL=1
MWEVKLRQGVKFHNGEPFDANAVKFSFERINRPDFRSPQKGWFATIEAVEIVDPYTVRFHNKVPDPAMPARMTLMYQLAPKYVAQVGDAQANLKPVGTGPFKFVEWVKNDKIVVEANDAHWTRQAGGAAGHVAAHPGAGRAHRRSPDRPGRSHRQRSA